jgi:hypothetical protein
MNPIFPAIFKIVITGEDVLVQRSRKRKQLAGLKIWHKQDGHSLSVPTAGMSMVIPALGQIITTVIFATEQHLLHQYLLRVRTN